MTVRRDACEERLADLASAAGGETPAGLDRHLAICDGCRDELVLLRQTEALLRDTAARPDDFSLSGFAYRVTDRAEAFRDRSPRGLWWSLTRAMRLTMGFSASTLALAAVLFVGSRHMVPAPVMAPAVVPVPAVVAPPVDVATLGSALAATPVAADDEIADDVDQMISDQSDQSDVSLDSALDSLSPAELDELAQQLETNSAG